jgi:predicted nuclease of restriction endonuclease-like (RecB) superfamily
MKLKQLVAAIHSVHDSTRAQAAQSINVALTLRNWLTGYYIVEFEQQGEDRAKYGDKLLETLADRLARNVGGFSFSNLKSCRQFYLLYPQIGQTVSGQFKNLPQGALSISQTLSGQLAGQFSLLVEKLSYSHFLELFKAEEPLKRAFYETQAIKENWSVRELKRQMGSLLFERMSKSKEKSSLLKRIHGEVMMPDAIIKNPYVFEFLGIPEKSEYTENQLETALINNLQTFLLELGKGFCFEARQKRITVNNQHYYIDLLFYHRILKCHVLIDLKVREFAHSDAGQMNFYLNYMKENETEKSDNPPVGIILCTHEDKAEVKFATAGLANKLFVSRYKLQLPTEKELRMFITRDVKAFGEKRINTYGQS